MSEYMFGIIHTKLTAKQADTLDTICRKEGGYGLNGSNNMPGEGPKFWFCGPNRGEPFDRELSSKVLARAEKMFPELFGLREVK